MVFKKKIKTKTKNNYPPLKEKKNPHKESKCVLVIKPKVLVPTYSSGCCLCRPPFFQRSDCGAAPSPQGQGTGAVKITGLCLCCSFDGRWVARLLREVKVPMAPTGTLVADI